MLFIILGAIGIILLLFILFVFVVTSKHSRLEEKIIINSALS